MQESTCIRNCHGCKKKEKKENHLCLLTLNRFSLLQSSANSTGFSLLEAGTKVKAKWTDGKMYSATVLSQHVAPSYVVSSRVVIRVRILVFTVLGWIMADQICCEERVRKTISDDQEICSSHQNLPKKLLTKVQVSQYKLVTLMLRFYYTKFFFCLETEAAFQV